MNANRLACIFSVSGLTLTDEEKRLFEIAQPYGFILFARNCETPDQVRTLTASLRETVDWHCPILIDQEGGRVQRLKPPIWKQHQPMRYYETHADELAADTTVLAAELRDVGVDVNCAPCLDVLTPDTHDVIGDRAFSDDPDVVAKLGLIAADTFLKNGITPVIKHLPGHGRATADSHLELPVVETDLVTLQKTDFVPFHHVANSGIHRKTWAMTAHVIYTTIDADHPVSVSPHGLNVIRNMIGFDGIVLSDDLGMKALDRYGDVSQKCSLVLEAGCDLALHCNGNLNEMRAIAQSCPKLRDDTAQRLQNAQNPRTMVV